MTHTCNGFGFGLPYNSAESLSGTSLEQKLTSMFSNGETGGLYSISSSMLYQDAAKTILAAALNDPVRVITPVYGSGDSVALNDAARPLLKSPGVAQNIVFDLVDDEITVPVTTAGSLFMASTSGMYWGQYDFSISTSFGDQAFHPRWPLVGWCAIDRPFTAEEIEALKSYFVSRGAVASLSGNIHRFMQNDPWTTVGGLLFSGVTSVEAAWYSCRLTSFPYSILQGAPAINYKNAWPSNRLNAESVDGILVTIRDNANAQNLLNGIIGLNSGTNAAPTDGTVTGMNGIQAKADLEARGWTVSTN